jgi:release factor glutamine methyltransferase
MGVDRAALIADPDRGLSSEAAGAFRDFARRRTQREPVAYILGRKGFRRIELEVDSRVLIPRPETEHVVEAGLSIPEGARVVDVGTGSGAIALALKDERPDLRVVATDASAPALDVARANATRLGLDIEFVVADLLDGVPGEIDAVLSNPPYVREGERLPPEITRYEPDLALYGGPEGLDMYRRLAAECAGIPFVAVEIAGWQAEAVGALFGGATEVLQDLAGIDRVVVVRR